MFFAVEFIPIAICLQDLKKFDVWYWFGYPMLMRSISVQQRNTEFHPSNSLAEKLSEYIQSPSRKSAFLLCAGEILPLSAIIDDPAGVQWDKVD